MSLIQVMLIASMMATNGDSMKLVQKETGDVVIEFKDNTAIFHSRFLEKALKEDGVLIPPAMRAEFGGKEVVFVDDPLFEKAFVEVYWPFYMKAANSSYEWQN
jgi:hypothetical protein